MTKGIVIENCDNVSVYNNEFVGVDVAIEAKGCKQLSVSANTITKFDSNLYNYLKERILKPETSKQHAVEFANELEQAEKTEQSISSVILRYKNLIPIGIDLASLVLQVLGYLNKN